MRTAATRLILICCLFTLVYACKKKDEPDPKAETCDKGLVLNDLEPSSGAKAIGLCGLDDGLITARYTRANGTDIIPGAQVGIMDRFGTNLLPRQGERLLVLSTGVARTPAQAGYNQNMTLVNSGIGNPPPGIPANNPSCPPGTNVYDDIVLELQLEAPANALGFSIDLAFYSFEFPNWLCNGYNDQFVVHMLPPPTGAQGNNILFDSNAWPMSVNSLLMDAANTTDMAGTGFGTGGEGGTTGWLRLSAPVSAGQIFTLKCFLFEVADNTLYSTVVLDNFRWLTTTTTLGTEKL
jgi:hypothetical protein